MRTRLMNNTRKLRIPLVSKST